MRRYGRWAGKSMGTKENTGLCVVQVWGDYYSHQCNRLRGHGPDGLYCKQHAKMLAEGRKLSVPEDRP